MVESEEGVNDEDIQVVEEEHVVEEETQVGYDPLFKRSNTTEENA